MLENIKVGDKVEMMRKSRYQDSSYGSEHTVVKVTKSQIHVEFKNEDALANGKIMKFNKKNGIEVGHANDPWGSYIKKA